MVTVIGLYFKWTARGIESIDIFLQNCKTKQAGEGECTWPVLPLSLTMAFAQAHTLNVSSLARDGYSADRE